MDSDIRKAIKYLVSNGWDFLFASLDEEQLRQLRREAWEEIARRQNKELVDRATTKVRILQNSTICAERCPMAGSCSQHESAGDHRAELGMTPNLHLKEDGYYCEQKETHQYHGPLILVQLQKRQKLVRHKDIEDNYSQSGRKFGEEEEG